MEKTNLKISVIGAGNIGSAVARGIASTRGNVCVYNRTASKLDALRGTEGIAQLTTDLSAAAEGAGVIVICVEGDAVEPVIKNMGKAIKKSHPVVVSCAAATSLAMLGEWLAPYSPSAVVRVLPNIAATCARSVNLVAVAGCDAAVEGAVCRLFESTGRCHVVPEKLFGAAMAISSCGIANVLRYVRAATEAGVELGLNPRLAKELAAGSVDGAAALVFAGDSHPEALVDAVTTPGGLTIRGVNTMEANGFSAAVIAGIKAAAKH